MNGHTRLSPTRQRVVDGPARRSARMQSLLGGVFLALAALPVAAQETRIVEPKRGAYVVKHADARSLSGILARHFKGAAEIQAGPEGTGHCLLINAPPAVFDEVMRTLEKIDRRPQSVAVEIFIVELPTKKSIDMEKRLDEKDLSGSIDDVAKRLNALLNKGQVAGFKRIQFRAVEGQPGSLVLGENKPFAMGPQQITYRNVGMQVKATPQVAADGIITLDLNIQDNRGRDSSTVKGVAEFVLTSLTGKISVAPGKMILAKDAKVISKEGEKETLILVGARATDSDAKVK